MSPSCPEFPSSGTQTAHSAAVVDGYGHEMLFVMFISKFLGEFTSVCPHTLPLGTGGARRVSDGECEKFGEVHHVRLITTRPRQTSGKQFTFVLLVHGHSPVNGLHLRVAPACLQV